MREQQFHQFRKQIGSSAKLGAKMIRDWFRTKTQAQRRLISGGLGLAVVAVLTVLVAMPAITSASEMDALGNGGFEQGFTQVNGCGAVGNHWSCFTNGGAANYGFYDDQWESTVYEGKSSQLIEINTKDMAAGDNDRYAGISQTARVVPGAPYKLSMRGMIRTTNKEGDAWRYSVQVGWLPKPNGDWQDVTNWVDVGWNTYYNRTEPGAFSAFQTQLVPDSEVITVFVRVWKKWGVAYEEIDVNLDAISLTGPAVNRPHEGPKKNEYDGIGGPVAGEGYRPEQVAPQAPHAQGPQAQGPQQPQEKPRESYRPVTPSQEYPVSCGGQDLVYNGSFEAGFVDVPWGRVGKGWEAYTNGGAANYGFYDEEWDIVVADGNHGQLIEINSKAVYPTDANRYAGISQRIAGLRPGETYELTVRGELRGVGNEDDPYRFAAQWGLGDAEGWQSVDEWTTMDLGPIAVRTEPAPLAQYKVRFEAPASGVVLYIQGWKKFAITNVEMDLNLDAISLRACDSQGPDKPQGGWQEPAHPGQGGPVNPGQGNQHPGGNDQGANCLYVVKPGDTLSQIAAAHGVSMDAIIRANGIDDPSAIYVGQKFEIPGCKGGERPAERSGQPEKPTSYNAERPSGEYEITQGERPAEMPQRSGPAIRPEAGQAPEAGPQEGPKREASNRTYTVQGGDMLTWIAQEHGVDAYELAIANGIDNMNFIYAGQVLIIPN